MSRKLLLVNPASAESARSASVPPLGLAYVAAVTPEGWDIQIVDEYVDELPGEDVDLVALTAPTAAIRRAYAIAGHYRERGIKVVLGGVHASMLPDEASRHVDAVVIGEAERIWAEVIGDFEKSRLRVMYRGAPVDLRHFSILPRRDLLSPSYLWATVQTSRGCPYSCRFCSSSWLGSRKYQQRSVDSVLAEIETIDNEYILFLDDNLIGYGRKASEKALQLFRGMAARNLGKKWWMQATTRVAGNHELLEAAAESGCMFALLGVENGNPHHFVDSSRPPDPAVCLESQKAAVEEFHRAGIPVLGAFTIGSGYRTKGYSKELADFALQSGIEVDDLALAICGRHV